MPKSLVATLLREPLVKSSPQKSDGRRLPLNSQHSQRSPCKERLQISWRWMGMQEYTLAAARQSPLPAKRRRNLQRPSRRTPEQLLKIAHASAAWRNLAIAGKRGCAKRRLRAAPPPNRQRAPHVSSAPCNSPNNTAPRHLGVFASSERRPETRPQHALGGTLYNIHSEHT